MPCPKPPFENMTELGLESRFLYESKFYKGVGKWRKCQIIKQGPLLAVC